MHNFPWDKPVQQRACLLLTRLFLKHGSWLCSHARKDEELRLKRVARNLKAQMEGQALELSGGSGGGGGGGGGKMALKAAGGGVESALAVAGASAAAAAEDGGDENENDDDESGSGIDQGSIATELTKNVAGLTKKERAQRKQAIEDAGMMDVMFALAAIQLRFGRRDVAMLFAVDQVLKSMS
jgi:hypothetical protein